MASQTQSSDSPNHIGKRLKALRLERNLTLSDVAGRANLSASHLSQIERDKVTPSLMTLASITGALEVNIRDLFEGEGDQIHICRFEEGNEPGGHTTLTDSQRRWSLEVERLTLHPGDPAMASEPFRGEVFGFILEGALEVYTDSDHFILEAGDSIHYDANSRYCLRCASDTPSIVIWCNSPPQRLDPAPCHTPRDS